MSEEYFVRKIGDATIFIRPTEGRDYKYEGEIRLADGVTKWPFDELGASPHAARTKSEDDEDLIDELATSAASFGAYYTSHNRGSETPDWAPEPEVADAIDDAVSFAQDDRGTYEVTRGVVALRPYWENPAGLTAKGERMYEHVKAGYAGDPRAKEIAARTVLARVKEGAPGLKKKNPRALPDLGMYGDGSLGHQHTRTRAAMLLEAEAWSEEQKPGAGARFNAQSLREVATALRGKMSDDAWEEDAACEALEDFMPHPDASWGWQDGDFGLWPIEN